VTPTGGFWELLGLTVEAADAEGDVTTPDGTLIAKALGTFGVRAPH